MHIHPRWCITTLDTSSTMMFMPPRVATDTKPFSIRLPPDIRHRADIRAAQLGISRNAYIAQLIEKDTQHIPEILKLLEEN